MVDWAGNTEISNYGIKREMDFRNLMELLWIILTLLVLAGVLIFHSWERSQIVNMGYESQRLQAIEESLLRSQRALILEEEILKNPQRIDGIARQELGMSPLRPDQILPPAITDVELNAAPALALAAPTISQ
ncbi:MAG: cell division protein FtsL, partial [Gammaproteobacteria bacterium]